jgi:hypothetical protein
MNTKALQSPDSEAHGPSDRSKTRVTAAVVCFAAVWFGAAGAEAFIGYLLQ